MSFSAQWDDIYKADQQITLWPWTDLVSAVMRAFAGDLTGKRVLELGCGPGANIRFFEEMHADYYAIEGSHAACLNTAHANVLHADFSEGFTAPTPFDLVCDRAAVTHNDTIAIERCLRSALAVLEPGGYYIGIDWFSTLHWSSSMGTKVDEHTRRDIPEGQFKDVGNVHFSDHVHLMHLFRAFDIVDLSHKLVSSKGNGRLFASWNIVARKPI